MQEQGADEDDLSIKATEQLLVNMTHALENVKEYRIHHGTYYERIEVEAHVAKLEQRKQAAI